MDAANIEPGAPFEFADRILSVPAVASSFESFLLAADRGAPLDGTLARLAFVATSPDKESADAALAHAQRLLRKVRRRRSQWLEDGDGLFRVWFDSVHEDGSHGRATASSTGGSSGVGCCPAPAGAHQPATTPQSLARS